MYVCVYAGKNVCVVSHSENTRWLRLTATLACVLLYYHTCTPLNIAFFISSSNNCQEHRRKHVSKSGDVN